MTDQNKRAKIVRNDELFIKKIRSVKRPRTINFPDEDPSELTDRELTRMARNAEAFPKLLEELISKPRRKR